MANESSIPPKVTPAGGVPTSNSERQRWATQKINSMTPDDLDFYEHNSAAIDLLFMEDPKVNDLFDDIEALIRYNQAYAKTIKDQEDVLSEELRELEKGLEEANEKKLQHITDIHRVSDKQRVTTELSKRIETLQTESNDILEQLKNCASPEAEVNETQAPKPESDSAEAEQQTAVQLPLDKKTGNARKAQLLQELISKYHDKRRQYHYLKALQNGLRFMSD